ncbi:transcription elongation factor GreA [Candidatus Gracilibacteria bacterium CG17_big_fil_post_rev_8_21_14_2_50_48_13]|nr:MAG: transcription elongation factor GreA [Candidatus Gracilibacteria bacterium CG17_big_fil_post_rev_8_21_14_2_50_48_13]
MPKKVQHFITKEGLEKLRKELEYLKTDKAREIAERLKEAISFGDLKENSEYQSARDEELLMNARISEIEDEIKRSEVITTKHKKGSSTIVEIGSQVTVKDVEGEEEPLTFTLVGSTENDPTTNRFSNESPLGEAVNGRTIGDEISYKAPKGIVRYTITAVE